MKTLYNKLFVGVFILCAAISCQVEEISSDNLSNNDSLVFTFFAEGSENLTKTIRQDDGAVLWDTAENIKIFCNGVSGKFTSDNAEPAVSTTFSGSFESKITLDDITTNGVMALYPYQEDATSDGSSITFSVPSEQIAVKGTFGKDLFPCIATSKGTNLSFYNVCSGIKFSVVNDDIRSVTFKTSEEEPIAGLIEVDYFWNDRPSVKVKEGVSEVTVYAPDNGHFEPGEFYYITILPPPAPTYFFWDGFTMVYNKDSVSDSITINEIVPLPRSKFGVVEGKDAGLLFIDYNKPIEFADPIMKVMCVNAFDTNKDGELSYAEARAVTDLSKMTLTKKTFKSFDELQYFINVKTIPWSYFQNSNIESITLHENMTAIDGYAFAGCVKLNHINLPENINFIGPVAFEGCSSLKTINIPEGVLKIEYDTFKNCSRLTSINIPEGVTSIGERCFDGCSSLTSINIPEGVTSIGGWCFFRCSNLLHVYVRPISPPTLVTDSVYAHFNQCASGLKIYVPYESFEAYKTTEGWSEYADAIVGYDFENDKVVE